MNHTTMSARVDLQNELEVLSRDLGIARYREALAKEGTTGVPAGQQLLKAAMEPMQSALTAWLEKTAIGLASRSAAQFHFVNSLDPVVSSWITAQGCLQVLHERPPLARVAHSIAMVMESALNMEAICAEQPALGKKLAAKLAKMGSGHNRAVFIRKGGALADVKIIQWDESTRIRVGTLLVHLFAGSTGLIAVETSGMVRGKTTVTVRPTESCMRWLEESHARCELLSPVRLPMVCPPRPWTNPFNGGYLNHRMRQPLVKTRNKGYLTELKEWDMPWVYASVNALQDTTWAVNVAVRDIVDICWTQGNLLGGLPAQSALSIPSRPWAEGEEPAPEVLHAWKVDAAKTYELNAQGESKRLQLSQKLYVAEMMMERGNQFHYVYNLDWRGRMYPVGPALTCKHFGYTVGKRHGKTVQIAPYYLDGQLVAQHYRGADKAFAWAGEPKGCELFGQHLWRDGGKKVVITEGEIDAMSVSQLQAHKWPVVSIPSGAKSAKKALAANLEWLERFEEVILMFDMDDPGKEATAECAPLFTPGRCKVAHLPLKDANEMLLATRGKEVIEAIWGAKPYRPDGIRSIADLAEEAEKDIPWGRSWFLKALDELTFGRRGGELYAFGAGTGVGKTDWFTQSIAFDLLDLGLTVGVVYLEQPPVETVRRIAGKAVGKVLHIPGKTSIEERREAIQKLVVTERLHLYDNFGSTSWDPSFKTDLKKTVAKALTGASQWFPNWMPGGATPLDGTLATMEADVSAELNAYLLRNPAASTADQEAFAKRHASTRWALDTENRAPFKVPVDMDPQTASEVMSKYTKGLKTRLALEDLDGGAGWKVLYVPDAKNADVMSVTAINGSGATHALREPVQLSRLVDDHRAGKVLTPEEASAIGAYKANPQSPMDAKLFAKAQRLNRLSRSEINNYEKTQMDTLKERVRSIPQMAFGSPSAALAQPAARGTARVDHKATAQVARDFYMQPRAANTGADTLAASLTTTGESMALRAYADPAAGAGMNIGMGYNLNANAKTLVEDFKAAGRYLRE